MRFKAAIQTTNTLKSIHTNQLSWIYGILNHHVSHQNKLIIYIKAIEPVAATTQLLKFSVAFITLLLYKNNIIIKTPKVKDTACITIHGNSFSYIAEITHITNHSIIAYIGERYLEVFFAKIIINAITKANKDIGKIYGKNTSE